MRLIIRNAKIVNEGTIVTKDILINNERIEKIDHSISLDAGHLYEEIYATIDYLELRV